VDVPISRSNSVLDVIGPHRILGGCFIFLENFWEDFSISLDCPPRILGGIIEGPRKEPPISIYKI
jgi:hypothetical protein